MLEEYTLDNRINTQYFIDTYGDVWKYKPTEDEKETEDIVSIHEMLARQILLERCGTSIYSPFPSAKSLICRMGYVIVGSLGQPYPFCTTDVTQSQIDKLFELGYKLEGTRPHIDDIGRVTTEHYFRNL